MRTRAPSCVRAASPSRPSRRASLRGGPGGHRRPTRTCRCPGAQFVRGPMPAGSASGPAVEQISSSTTTSGPGSTDDPVGGALDPDGHRGGDRSAGRRRLLDRRRGSVPNVATPMIRASRHARRSRAGSSSAATRSSSRAVDDARPSGLPGDADPRRGERRRPTRRRRATWSSRSRGTPSRTSTSHVVDPAGGEIYWGNQSSQPPFRSIS